MQGKRQNTRSDNLIPIDHDIDSQLPWPIEQGQTNREPALRLDTTCINSVTFLKDQLHLVVVDF